MSVVARLLLVVCVALTAGASCGQGDSGGGSAWVRTLTEEPRDPVNVESVTATGLRDGESTQARFVLEARSFGNLELDVEIRHKPQPLFVSGRWSVRPTAGREPNEPGNAPLDATTSTERPGSAKRDAGISGLVMGADGLHFLGGQGGRPSLGGRFTLGRDGKAHYEVYIPPTPLQPSGGTRKGRFGGS